jgi:hypothetical protein
METKTKIFKKLLQFQLQVETIKKDGKNSFFKKPDGKASSYATLPNILEQVKPILNSLNLVLTQPIVNNEVFSVVTDSESGEQESSSIKLPDGLNAQQTGSAVTYFRRYTLSSLLSLEIDEDDDGNKASNPVAKKEAAKPVEKEYLKPNDDKFTKAVEWLKKDGTMDKLKAKYNVSAAVEKLLMDAVLQEA